MGESQGSPEREREREREREGSKSKAAQHETGMSAKGLKSYTLKMLQKAIFCPDCKAHEQRGSSPQESGPLQGKSRTEEAHAA